MDNDEVLICAFIITCLDCNALLFNLTGKAFAVDKEFNKHQHRQIKNWIETGTQVQLNGQAVYTQQYQEQGIQEYRVRDGLLCCCDIV